MKLDIFWASAVLAGLFVIGKWAGWIDWSWWVGAALAAPVVIGLIAVVIFKLRVDPGKLS